MESSEVAAVVATLLETDDDVGEAVAVAVQLADLGPILLDLLLLVLVEPVELVHETLDFVGAFVHPVLKLLLHLWRYMFGGTCVGTQGRLYKTRHKRQETRR